jgi:hypothetical protein
MSPTKHKDNADNPPSITADQNPGLSTVSRRTFLKIASAFVAVSSIGVVAGCDSSPVPPEPVSDLMGAADNVYPEVPVDPMVAPSPNILKVFSVHEAQTVEALTARIMPGTPADPGAREAGVVTYIDNMLAFNEGYDEPTYRQAPFAETYTDNAPINSATPGQYQVIYVAKDQIARYGYQSIMTPRETYRAGLVALDQYAKSKFNANFADLTDDQQDQIVADLADDKATGFSSPSGADFFKLVRTDTINGMFSDPGYGGNQGMVGWLLIGYPGAQRAYTADDIRTEGHVRAPQSMAQMSQSRPGQAANADVIMPQSGQSSSDDATMVPSRLLPAQH